MDRKRFKSLIIYSLKCIVGSLIVLIGSPYIPSMNHYDTMWCILSILLILSPDGKESMNLAIIRIKANLLGASVGFAFMMALPESIHQWLIPPALFFTLLFGYLLKLDSCLRSALVATVIVMMPHQSLEAWSTPLERVFFVISGCVLAIVITYIFHFKERETLKIR